MTGLATEGYWPGDLTTKGGFGPKDVVNGTVQDFLNDNSHRPNLMNVGPPPPHYDVPAPLPDWLSWLLMTAGPTILIIGTCGNVISALVMFSKGRR